MTTFTKTNEQLAARRARVKEMEMQGRVFNSAMRARAIREAKRMQKIEDIADNIIAGLQSNPNVKREVVKVQEVEYIDTTGFDIVNLGSADKDAYSNHRRAEYSNTKKLENAADAILKELQAEAILNELQSEDDDNNNSDEDKMDAILNSIRNEDEDDNNIDEDEIDDNNDIDEDILDDILNSIQNEDEDDNNIDEDEMNSILNMVRNDNADNYMDEEVIVENNNSETDDNNDTDEIELDDILNATRYSCK